MYHSSCGLIFEEILEQRDIGRSWILKYIMIVVSTLALPSRPHDSPPILLRSETGTGDCEAQYALELRYAEYQDAE